jgi:predicted nucleic acid-binding protein
MEDRTVFIDTSAFFALMDQSDLLHEPAAKVWTYLVENDVPVITSNYIVVETTALLQSRLGFEAARLWKKDIFIISDTLWIDEKIQILAFELWMSLGRRKISLVDCSSFIIMRNNGIDHFFGFDSHFEDQGFIPFRN